MLKLGKCSQDISTGRCSVKKLRVQQIFGEELGEDVKKKKMPSSIIHCSYAHICPVIFFPLHFRLHKTHKTSRHRDGMPGMGCPEYLMIYE